VSGRRASCRVHEGDLRPTGLPWSVPTLTIEHAAPGPRVAICAGLHGDEAVGVGVVLRLHRELPEALLRGTVRLYPCLNPEGLRAGARLLPGESLDLNRAFPGDARGNGPRRLAHAVWQDLMSFAPEAVLDLHADSPACIPYAILDRLVRHVSRPAQLRRQLKDLAHATGLTVIHDYASAPYRRFELDRSLTGALLNRAGLPAVTLELGPRRFLDPKAIDRGAVAVLGALDQLGLVASPAPPHPSRAAGGPWRRDSGPVTTMAGLLCPVVSPGQRLVPGQPLAELRRLDGALVERVVAHHRSLVLSLAERAWVTQGEHVATLGVPDD
jgi:uncharacterized protein